MDYGGMEFMRLTEEIEDQGGTHLAELHERRTIKIPKQAAKGERQRASGSGCLDAALFSIPFERGVFGGDKATDQMFELGEHEGRLGDGNMAYASMAIDEQADAIVVCAKDDCVGLWPRFIGTWEEEE